MTIVLPILVGAAATVGLIALLWALGWFMVDKLNRPILVLDLDPTHGDRFIVGFFFVTLTLLALAFFFGVGNLFIGVPT